MKDENAAKTMQKRIEKIKKQLETIGDMRPGNLTQQYRDAKKRVGLYHQLSYTHKMKSRTDYVREGYVDVVKSEVEQYRRFKELTEEWIDLAIEISRAKMKIMRDGTPKKPTRTKGVGRK